MRLEPITEDFYSYVPKRLVDKHGLIDGAFVASYAIEGNFTIVVINIVKKNKSAAYVGVTKLDPTFDQFNQEQGIKIAAKRAYCSAKNIDPGYGRDCPGRYDIFRAKGAERAEEFFTVILKAMMRRRGFSMMDRFKSVPVNVIPGKPVSLRIEEGTNAPQKD